MDNTNKKKSNRIDVLLNTPIRNLFGLFRSSLGFWVRKSIDHRFDFQDGKIVDRATGGLVMHAWQAPVAEKMGEIVSFNRGDILEIGYGMGISAAKINQYCVRSHTIIENHPQILKELRKWATDKDHVTIMEGHWWKLKDRFGQYDGILFDTYADPHEADFLRICHRWLKKDGKVAYFFPVFLNRYEMFPNRWRKCSIIKVKVSPQGHKVGASAKWMADEFPILVLEY